MTKYIRRPPRPFFYLKLIGTLILLHGLFHRNKYTIIFGVLLFLFGFWDRKDELLRIIKKENY